jgi:putative spermidine/putrescine transport system substrate-binding protein
MLSIPALAYGLIVELEFGAGKVDAIHPSISIVAENPVAVVERTVAKKGTAELANAYKYLDLVAGKEVQEALTKPPYNFIPVNKDVVLPADLPMKSLDEMSKYVEHDWAKINPLRAAWIEKFNKEMAK